MTIFYQDEYITLYHGDAREIVPSLEGAVDAVITDPPYGETSLEWDRWPAGWPGLLIEKTKSLWCFGSLRMFMDKAHEFKDWKLAQDIIWEKHNGSNSSNDRFRRMHEGAAHFYRGEWGGIYKNPQYTYDAVQKSVKRTKNRTAHWGDIGQSAFKSEDGGPRLQGSVIYARSCHGYAVHPTQKPEAIVTPILQYSVPKGGTVLDLFSGSGTTLIVAKKYGCRAIGIEGRRDFCERMVDRLSQGILV